MEKRLQGPLREGDMVVDNDNKYMGKIRVNGLTTPDKVRITNATSKRQKTLQLKDCVLIPPKGAFCRHKKTGTWWVVHDADIDGVTMDQIKVFVPSKNDTKDERVDNLM